MARSLADLQMMLTETPQGPYPYAGVPWFSTVFGRDGIITALECSGSTRRSRAACSRIWPPRRPRTDDPEQDAEPGKILHETRAGEMAALGEVPFGRYYGSVDATPLFVMLAGAYFERTGDLAFAASDLAARRAGPRMDRRLRRRERRRLRRVRARAPREGSSHQGWKDSSDSVFHADGTLAEPPIALVRGAGVRLRGQAAPRAWPTRSAGPSAREELRRQAEELRVRFEDAFWCEDLGTYALALDGDKQPCRVRTSNAGHCLFAGIASPGARRPRRARFAGEYILLRMGHPHRRGRRGPLQPDVVSQRLGLAARQRDDRGRACPATG